MTKLSAGLSRVRCFACVSTCNFSRRTLGTRVGASAHGIARVLGIVQVGALALAGAVGVFAQGPSLAPSWNKLSPATAPSARYFTGTTYDAGHSQVVLFGGITTGGVFANDTWVWNGTWANVTPSTSNPPGRSGFAMTYDAAHGKVVLFGGRSSASGNLGDTWLWDGTTWTQVFPNNSPGARNNMSMVYDAATGNVVLFGGDVTANSGLASNDTWTWDGSNWTQQFPSAVTPTRDSYSMAYDAAHGQVVMFGGTDQFGNNLNDTWVWNGSNWTLKTGLITPAPSARFGSGMDYDAALGQVVLFGGIGSSGGLNDTWSWDGSNWTQQTTTASPSAREVPGGMVYDPQQNQMLLFGGFGSSPLGDTWEFSPQQNFGNINVCPNSASTPAPCSATLALTYKFANTANLGGIQVVTEGAFNLDFNQANGNTCTGTIAAGNSCTLNISFTPTVPGLRRGTVKIFDNSVPSNLLVSTPIYGVGSAPLTAFSLGTQTTVPTSGVVAPSGVAVDAAGNLYISGQDSNNVVKVTPLGVQSTVASGLAAPYDVAVDGAGDVFIADFDNNRVVEVTPQGVQTTVPAVGLNHPNGVAVDGTGNLFITDSGNNRIVEITPSGVQSTVPTSGLATPFYLAIDAAGDLFFVDAGNQRVVKVTPGGIQSTIFTSPFGSNGVAVDAAGDVFISTQINNQVVEVTPSGVQTVVTTGLSVPAGVAVDGSGNLFIADHANNRVVEINLSAPAVNLGVVSEGTQSPDTPLSIQNIGNQTLTGSLGPLLSTSIFEDVPASNCLTFTLAPGASCVENFYAFPLLTSGTISASVSVSDNSLNGNPSIQQISVSALSLGPAVSVNVTGGGAGSGFVQSNPTGINCNLIAGVPSGTCSINYSTGLQISFQEVPTNGSTFVGWGGACASQGTNQICVITVTAATSVTATFASSATTFPLSVTLVGSGGAVASNPAGISCSVANGTDSGTCASSFAGGTPVTLTATGAAGSTFVGWSGACTSAGISPTCNVVVNQATNAIADFVQQNFGTVNVCPTGQSTPAPCSQTIALTYTIPVTTTIGVIQAVTQGVTGLDFSLANGGTCTGTIAAGTSCTVNATFAPLAAGLRSGQVRLFDNNGNLILSTLVYGTGASPVSAFSPSAQLAVNTGTPLNYPNGLLTDAASNLFIADGNNQRVLKVAPNGSVTTVASGLGLPQGMAEDGAGNLFIANNSGSVLKIPAGCTNSACQQPISNPFGFQSELGVALDPAGNLFVGDFLSGQVAEVPANGGPQTIVYSPTGCGNAPGCSDPVDLTTDTAGNLFIADFGLKTVAEVPVGCTTQSCVKSIGTGWSQPDDVAVDAAGNVFVADQGLKQIVEVPFGCTTAACQIVLVNGISTVAVKVDAAGDVFFDNVTINQVFEITRSLPPSLSFALTNVGSTSTDSPQLVSVQNVGNQTLTGSVALSLGANFAENPSSGCGGGFSLTPGTLCTESFGFAPQSTGAFTGSAIFSDNTFNLSPLVVVQGVNLSGTGGLNGQAVQTVVPNLVGMTQAAATAALTNAGLTLGAVSSGYSSSEPAGSVMGESPAAGTQVNPGSAVAVRLSIGQAPAVAPNPLSLLNNYFVTGGYATNGVTLRATGVAGMATGTISIPKSTSPGAQGVPDGADIVDGYLYWEALENTATPSANTGTFLGYSITGQQVGSDLPFTDGAFSGTLRVYRANVNAYVPVGANGIRFGSGNFTVSLPDSGGTGFPITEGASLVEIYRVLSPDFPLTAVVLYDGAAIPATATTQNVQGFYDAAGGPGAAGSTTFVYYANNTWNGTPASVSLGQSNQYIAPLNAGNAYAAVILSTPVNNSDKDGILDAWKTGPPSGDFFFGQPGYYDVKTSSWVPLPGAKHGQKDLFVQFDYMCGSVLASGACDPTQENLYPSPDANGNDPLVMVTKAFAAMIPPIALHLQVGNAVAESICTDNLSTNPPQLCQFPAEPGVIGWKNSLEFSKLWPRNFASCVNGGDCTARFPYGQKDSYHYVLFGHSLAIPAWNSRYGSLTGISVANGVTTISTTDRGNGINACPSRVTISGVLSNPKLNGIYNTSSCPDTRTMIVSTPGVPDWSYSFASNTPPEPAIGIISGTVTSISGYSDLGGADSAVTLGLWATAPNQDMSKRANVVAGTLFHEIGHTLGLSHGGLYYTPGSYVPTFDVNCKPNYQSSMNYLFQLDGVGPNAAIAYSNQTLNTLDVSSLASVGSLTDGVNAATYPTSAWYVPYTAGSTTASPATRHCDGTPLNNDAAYRVDASITSNPGWANGQNIAFDGVPYTTLRGYNDVANLDLRQVGATGGQFASLAGVLSFGSVSAPVNIAPGGNVTLGSGGTVTLGSGGNITLGSGGNVTLGSGGTIAPGSSGIVTLNNGGTVTMSAGTITLGSGGNITLGSGGNVTLGSGGTITLGSGGNVTLGSGGTVTLGSGGTITLAGGGSITIPSSGGTYTLPSGGGTITLGSGGNVTLGSGGNVTLGSGGTITLGSGGNVTLGSGGNVTLGSGGNITLGSGGNVTLGSGGNVTLGSGGNITLGSGGNVTLGSGGTITLGSGGNVTLGSGGNVTLGSGGNITLGSGGNVVMGSGGTITLGSGGGTIDGVQEPAGTYQVTSGQNVTFGSSGGNVTLGSGGNVTLGSGGNITLGSGGTITLGSGGNVTLGSGGTVTLGSGGNITLGSGGNVTLGSGGNITLGSGGVTTDELNYDTANSFVRPPPSATYTAETSGITVNWTPPVFGVVQSYTVYLSVNGGTPVKIGTVIGVNGNPPVTSFTDNNSYPAGSTLKYTITTTLVPDTNGSQRQSLPSPPAVLTLDQTIVFNPAVPSSVVISGTPLQVTAYAQSVMNGQASANGLQVSFTAAGACSIGSQSFANNASTAMVNLNNTGSCTITASQAGSISTQTGGTSYNAAQPVSATFAILAENSGTTPQIINFPQLPNIQYGKTFALNATDNSGITINYNITGPCSAAGKTTGIGTCTITATAPAGTMNNITYSAASVSQSFSIDPAVLTVTAGNLTSGYGTIPSLTNDYTVTGFVNGESAAVLNNTAPALSTTATATSGPAIYPIAISAGTLSAANYTFFLVPGTLTIQAASQTITFTTPAPAAAPYKGTFPVAATSTSQLPVTLSVDAASASVCSLSHGTVTMNSGTGTCTIDANQAGNADYSAAAPVKTSATATPAAQTITFSTPAPASAPYKGTFPVAATSTSNLQVALSVDAASTSVCSLANGVVTMISGTGTCTINANQAGNANYSAATQVKTSATATLVAQSITFTTPAPASAPYKGTFLVAATSTSGLTVALSVDAASTSVCALSNGTVTMNSGTGTCTIDANQSGNTNYSAAAQVKTSATATLAPQTITFTTPAPAFALYKSTFPVAATSTSGLTVALSVATASTSVCSLSNGTVTMNSSTGTCTIDANQAGNGNYSAAPQVMTSATATASAPPSGTACNGIYSGTFSGSLTVTNGQNCVFVGGGVTGSITERGGNLSLSGGAKIGNGITVNGGTFTIGPSTTITGNLTIQSMPISANTNQVCGTAITGNLVFQSNGTAVLIGNNASCAGNNVKGTLQVQSNSSATTIDGNTVGANLQDLSNAGATQVFKNSITKALQCSSNTSITGGGNTAASKQGQCATF